MFSFHTFFHLTAGDQLPWTDVKKEITDEKGLSSEAADKIGEYVKLKGPYAQHHRIVD
jgi:hypothetical protein